MIRPILHYPNPILKRKAKAVAKITPDIHRLIQDMLETMYDAPGVGLAAPQIGVSLRIVVIDVSEDHSSPMVFVNPKVTRLSKEKTSEQEGCLSIPGIVGQPVRSLSASIPANQNHRWPGCRHPRWPGERTRPCNGCNAGPAAVR